MYGRDQYIDRQLLTQWFLTVSDLLLHDWHAQLGKVVRMKVHSGEVTSWFSFCSVCVVVNGREYGRVLPASRHQPGRSWVQVDGQRFPSDHQRLHVCTPCWLPPIKTFPVCRGTLSEICHSAFTPPLSCFAPRLDISVKAATLGWPVLPTCLWRVSWSEERGWSLWGFCVPPTLCFTATCTSWRTKSG